MKKILAISLFVIGTTGVLCAAEPYHVPEIDASSAASATALVGSALLMIRRKKAN